MRYAVSQLFKLLDGTLKHSVTDPLITHICYDSRLPIYGEHSMFVALKTAKADGHQYVQKAYDAGCRTFLTDQPVKLPEDCNHIEVDDCLRALQHLARQHRMQFQGTVIGITGSWGKTTVKEWLYEIVGSEHKVVKSPKSFNSQLGVALSLLNIEPEHEIALIEAGISEPGDMASLEAMIQPDIGIFTTLAEAHQANFSSMEEKLLEKLQLFKRAKRVLFNSDKHQVAKHLSTLYPNVARHTWGAHASNDLQVTALLNEHVEVRFNNEHFQLKTSSKDAYHYENVMHAAHTALQLGIPSAQVAESVKRLKPLAMRLEMKPGQHGITLVNDSYSADFYSLEVGLNYLHKVAGDQRKTLILSEFDQQEISESDFIGRLDVLAKAHSLYQIVLVGKTQFSEKTLPSGTFINTYAGTSDLLKACNPSHFANEAILVKGARRFQLEKVIHLLQAKSHRTQLELNTNALVKNYNWFKQHLPKDTSIMVMLKALSYGAGTFEIARLLQNLGVNYLAVAYTDEGVTLRENGIQVPIMVLNPDEEGFVKMLEYDLEPEVYSISLLTQLRSFMENSSGKIKVHINIDTGMHRLGFMPEEVPELARSLQDAEEQLEVASVFCHLSGADETEHNAFTLQQLQLLRKAVGVLQTKLNQTFLVHAGNSAGAIAHPESVFDMVRLGIGFYGLNTTEKHADLDLAFRLSTRISQIKQIKKGESVGYSRSWYAKEDRSIATIPMGYADGLPRILGNEKGRVYINGHEAPFIGAICMDMSMIDISGIPVNEGDEVVIFENQDQLIQLSNDIGTIPYEVLAGISPRVKRIYLED